MSVYNPPFPHQCRIVRKIRKSVIDDEPVVDEFSDVDNVEDPFLEEGNEQKPRKAEYQEDVVVVYEGACMAYPKHTTTASGEVITSLRGLAVPVTSDGWVERGDIPKKTDEVYAWRGLQREFGKITDVDAANFGGTEIIWRVDGN